MQDRSGIMQNKSGIMQNSSGNMQNSIGAKIIWIMYDCIGEA